MLYHVLFTTDDRPTPRYFASLDATDDDHVRGLVHAEWPGEGDLYFVPEDGVRLVQMQDGSERAAN
jgi:hypothetical protein